jgi:hypothetical protein
MKRSDLSPLRTSSSAPRLRWSATSGRACFSLGLALTAALTGCNVIPAAQNDPTKFYVLSAPRGQAPESQANAPAGRVPPTENSAAANPPAAKKVRLGLKTVEVANYLKGPEMVVRSGTNEVTMQEYARWAEPIQAGVTRLLREQLAGAANVAQIDVQPFSLDQPRDFDIAVTILHCEGAAGGADGRGARFEASIRISTAGLTPELVARKIYTAPAAAWDGQNFDKLAQLLSADVQGLGAAILETVP